MSYDIHLYHSSVRQKPSVVENWMSLSTHHSPKLPLPSSLVGWSNAVTSCSRKQLNARPSANKWETSTSMYRFTTLRLPSLLRVEMQTPFLKRFKMLLNCVTRSIWRCSIRRLASGKMANKPLVPTPAGEAPVLA